MNKEETEIIQKEIDNKHLETQGYGRNLFVCKIVELERYIETLQSQLDIANKKLEQINKITPLELANKKIDEIKEITPLKLAKTFHLLYEAYAPSFGYETREETREFDENSNNGKLMIAVCGKILEKLGGE